MASMSSLDKLPLPVLRVKDFCFGSDLRKGLTVSISAHLLIGAVIAATLVDWSVPPKPEKRDAPLISFQINSPESSIKEQIPIPAVARPTVKKNATGKPVDAPVAEVAFQEGGSGNMTIWTPPPPVLPTKEGQLRPIESSGKGTGESMSAMPIIEFVDMEGDEGAPVLVSHDIGLFSGADALAEATRLQGAGSLRMLVVVEKSGSVIGCSTVESSGSNVLDDLGCGLVMTYRYQPAKDKSDEPIDAMIYEALEWNNGNPVERVTEVSLEEDPQATPSKSQ